jgi:hypothetical protein
MGEQQQHSDFLEKTSLLAYNSCMGVSLWISIHAYSGTWLGSFSPSFVPFPNVLSLYAYIKYIDDIHPPVHSLFTLLPSASTLPPVGPALYSCPSLFKCKFIIQRSFAMVFYLGIYSTLVSLAPSITLPSLSPYPILFSCFHFISMCLLPDQVW